MSSSRQYVIPVFDTLGTAWSKVYGSKGAIWGGLGILMAIMIGIGILEGVASAIGIGIVASLIGFISQIVAFLLQLGLIYMGICRAKDQPINYNQVFYALNLPMALNIIGLYVLQFIIFIIPSIIMVSGAMLWNFGGAVMLLGIILFFAGFCSIILVAIRVSLSVPIVLDQMVGPVEAIKKSIKATDGNFWNLMGLYVAQMLIFFIAILPLGIGLIWCIPFGLITYGVVYDKLRQNI